MARKKAVRRVKATTKDEADIEREARAIRLALPEPDAERLEACAGRRGLSLAAYARMAVLDLIRRDEREATR